jgi:tetratricopeptide (TPR) repeat protein
MLLTFALLFSFSVSNRTDTTLTDCVAATQGDDRKVGAKMADGAERHYRAMLAANPNDVETQVQLARTLSQCRIRYAGVLSREGIVNQSNGLLKHVLERDSTHWEARYTLALNHYHVPRFFGRTDDAIREFEHLLAQQGDRTDFPERAAPFAYLGDLYVRVGRRADAAALWKRGLALFPRDDRLRHRLEQQSSGNELR